MPWNKDGTRKKSSTYKMKYQGDHGAFPFKGESPLDLAIVSPAIERGMQRFNYRSKH